MLTSAMVRITAVRVAWLAGALTLAGCGSSEGTSPPPPPPLTGWAAIRANAAPQLALTTVFDTPRVQPIALDGWEDGIFISRDGLQLYAIYVPADLLSFIVNGGDQNQAASYLRGPTLGMDLTTNPVGASTWIHGDIVQASRASTAAPFSPWRLTAMARPAFSEGAVTAQGSGAAYDLFVYTSNDHAPDYKAHTCLRRNVPIDPTDAPPVFLPAPVTTSTNEDNPHIERLTATDLVLFFDSDDRPGAPGMHDLWVTTSADDGVTWTAPAPVTSLNDALSQQQPHLFRSPTTGVWWLYYTATNPVDGKLGIFRASQATVGDWNSWTGVQLVVGAGNTAGIGEPTLTANGDLSFVVVTRDDAAGTATNRYDADPWYAPRLPTGVVRRDGGVGLPLALTTADASAHALSR